MKYMKIIKRDLEVWDESDTPKGICWYKSDKRHREDGPTEAWSDGTKFFYLNDEGYDEEYYWNEIHENY